jgi:hypothetical protein
VSVQFTRADGTLTPARDHGVKVTRTVSLRGADGRWTELKSGASVPVGSYLKVRVSATPRRRPAPVLPDRKPEAGRVRDDRRHRQEVPAKRRRGGHVLREDREAMTCFHYEQIGRANAEFVVLAEFAG